MMSLEAIHQLGDEIALKAAQDGLMPYVPFNREEIERIELNLPHLGSMDYNPPGWERIDVHYREQNGLWFVDKCFNGDPAYGCLGLDEFKQSLLAYYDEHPDHGYALVEEGQFQVHVAAYRPVE